MVSEHKKPVAYPYEQFRAMQDDPEFKRKVFERGRKLIGGSDTGYDSERDKKSAVRDLQNRVDSGDMLIAPENLRLMEVKDRLTGKTEHYFSPPEVLINYNSMVLICSTNPEETFENLRKAIEQGRVFRGKIRDMGTEDDGTITSELFRLEDESYRKEGSLIPFAQLEIDKRKGFIETEIRKEGTPIKLNTGEGFQIELFAGYSDASSKILKEFMDYLSAHNYKFVLLNKGDQYHIAAYNEGKEEQRGGNLEGKVTSIIAISGVLVALFFLSTNITGNAIGNLNQTNVNVVGVLLLVIGLVAGYFWMKKK